MARYYEETALIEFVKQYTPHINGETTMQCVERAIRNAPTADVVPKSEVEATVEKLMSATDKAICEAKAEVAREIFEEMEECFMGMLEEAEDTIADAVQEENKSVAWIARYGRDVLIIARNTLTKMLKKKYTEGEK